MMEKFVFPLPPTLNEIIGTARSNIYASAKEKRAWTNTIAVKCFGRKRFPDRVWIEFVWKIKNFRRDPDNVSAAAKFVMDGLVEGGIIQDDSLKFIMSPVLHWYEKGKDLVEINLADHPIWNGHSIDLAKPEFDPVKQPVIVSYPEILLEKEPLATDDSLIPVAKVELQETPDETPIIKEVSYSSEFQELAALINREYQLSISSPVTAMLHARNAGKLLLKTQELLAPSEWLIWLNANCQVSEQSAKTYMAIAKSWVSVNNSATLVR